MELVYYDIGAFPEPVFPFDRPENHVFLKKYVGVDPRFDSDRVEGKYVYYKFAAHDTNTTKKFHTDEPFEKSNDGSLLEYTDLHWHPSEPMFDIQCRKLSDIIRAHGGEIDILKIDAHGSEMPILRDVEGYLKDVTAVNVEAWCSKWYEGAELLDVTDKFLTSMAFAPVKIIDGSAKWAVDLLYINTCADVEKIELVKKLYEVESDASVSKHVKHRIKKMRRRENDERTTK